MTIAARSPDTVRVGFLPLVDAAILVAAREQGFAAAQAIDLQLVREASWANIRDKIVHGHLDVAHMLAGLPIATTLGLAGPCVAMAAPFNLGLNGNAVTLSTALADTLGPLPIDDPALAAQALARVARHRARAGAPLRLGVVHSFSSHNYMLRYWLASAGIDPDHEVELIVVPPPFTVDALATREVDGVCVGEPWNSAAVHAGVGRIAAFGCRIWQRGVEKVLGCRADWADAHPGLLDRLLRALDAAARWAANPANHAALAALLAAPGYLNTPRALIRRALDGHLPVAPGGAPTNAPDFLLLHSDAANFPWISQALWLYSQMVRWRQAPLSNSAERAVRGVFRPDLYRRALAAGPTPLPGASAKVEGALDQPLGVGSLAGRLSLGPDRFFDQRVFDPDDVGGYLRSFRGQRGEAAA